MQGEHVLDGIAVGVITVNSKGIVCTVNKPAAALLSLEGEKFVGLKIDDIIPEARMGNILNAGERQQSIQWLIGDETIIITSKPLVQEEAPAGAVITLQKLSELKDLLLDFQTMQALKTEIENLNTLNNQLMTAFDYCFDEVYVTDGQGYTVFVSKACEKFYGVNARDMLGKHVNQLEKDGIFSHSVSREVLQKKHQVSLIQGTNKGRKLLVTANPVFSESGDIELIVTISRDITETSNLKDKLVETEELSKMYLSEIERLKTGQSQSQELVVVSEPMKQIMDTVKRIAKVDSTIFIEGESGVGKGVVASRIHQQSKRAEKAFISVNCGAIPENLIESELFGYESGAFTGAQKGGKKGLFEAANGGSIFLDEIGELPLSLQVKLLHVIQEKKLRRIGGNKDIIVDVRIIAATNRNIQQLVQQGKFREDLFYRLNVIPLSIPPLRHRRGDIIPLIEQFLKKFNDIYRLKKQVSEPALEALSAYNWPGNVRELENLIERLVVTSDTNRIDTCHLPDHLTNSANKNQKGVMVLNICPLKRATEEMESQLIQKAHERYKNTYRIAEALQINQSTVVRKMHKYFGDKEEADNK
ncbi:MAG: PAS domain-containing protein [Firmicutes bacterium]|nr:PAS domain-containing protein [Bacillota bacterium]